VFEAVSPAGRVASGRGRLSKHTNDSREATRGGPPPRKLSAQGAGKPGAEIREGGTSEVRALAYQAGEENQTEPFSAEVGPCNSERRGGK